MKKSAPWLAAGGSAAAAFGVAWMLATPGEPGEPAAPAAAPSQRIVAAEGTVEAMRGHEAEVGSQLTARIERFLVNEGDWVTAGQVIAVLDNADTLARLDEARGELAATRAKLREIVSGAREEEITQAAAVLAARRAELELAAAELERHQRLSEQGILSASMLNEREKGYRVAAARVTEAEEQLRLLENGARRETVELHERLVDKAKATVELYERLLEKSSVRSPIAGKVIHKNLEVGEVVYAEAPVPLVTVADLAKTWINAEVDEIDVGRISVGHRVDVSSDAYPDRVFRGRIAEIADYVGSRTVRPNDAARNLDMKVVQVKVILDDESPLLLGMGVNVRIHPE